MRFRSVVARCVVLAVVAYLATPARAANGPIGGKLYRQHCAVCHGLEGRGDGPDADLYEPRPRSLRSGVLAGAKTGDVVRRVREGTPLTPNLSMLGERARHTEALAAHLERLPKVDRRLVDAGQEVYIDQCELCHGPYGRPATTVPAGIGTPRDLSDPAWQRTVSDDELVTVVRHGRKGMPALVPRIEESDARAVAAFVRLLSPGYELYERYCTSCHGEDGRGGGGLVERPAPTVVFDAAYFARRDPEDVRAAIWHMVAEHKNAMPHLRDELDEATARTIIEYLKRADGR